MLRAILNKLRSRWFLTFVGVALAAALIWVFGPFFAVLAGALARGAVILLLFAVWAIVNLILDRKRREADKLLIEGITQSKEDTSAAASSEEAAAMREKLATALALLKKASGNRGYLYEQPWYVIIGPPGAGKTTALLNAGLTFPLAAEMGQSAVAGVGGTRMCEWWFTEDAVLIDTAGRYTTQDSDAAVDKAGWNTFLSLLRRTRARQPLNGVLVAISLADIAAASPAERSAHARAIRRRIKDIYDQLGVKVPVYALFTKADLIAGFTEFFDDLDRDRRGQVWGMTFPPGATEAGHAGAFAAEFALLVERVNQRLLDRLQAERSPDRRTAIAGFPAQVASLAAPLGAFVAEAFGGSRLDPAPMLRGAYLTSGTQEGTPIDRLTGTLARAFGIDQARAPSLRPEQGRSYFLTRLLKDVVFGEAMLIARDPVAVRRGMLMRYGAAGLAALVVLAGTAALIQTRSVNENAIARSDATLAAYAKTAAATPLSPVQSADFAAIDPVLNAAQQLPFGAGAPAPATQWFPGLSQLPKLHTGATIAYQNALSHVLLPRLIWLLEQQMRAHLDDPAYLYEATRIYLMLGSDGPLDRASIREWMHYSWQALYPGAGEQPLRASLEAHLAALLDQPLAPVPLDGALVADARRIFSRISLAQRVYGAIARSRAAQAVPPFDPAAATGPGGARFFVRASGEPMTQGIPGFFTVAGFHDVLLPMLPAATREVASESWVLGRQEQISPDSAQSQALQQQVVALYVADYEKHWSALLRDLDLAPMPSLQQAAQDLFILSSPQSPIKQLLTAVARQLQLSQPLVPPGAAAAKAAGAVKAVTGAATSSAARLQSLLGRTAAPPPPPPGQAVDQHYAPLIAYVGAGPGAPIDGTLKLMNDLQQQLAQLAAAPPGGAAPAAAAGADPAGLLQAEAGRDPQPVSRWLQSLSVRGNTLRGGGARAQAAAAFSGPGGPGLLCRQAVEGRYPFFPASRSAIPLADFGRLFAPNGLLDSYFNTQLRPFVDTSGPTWRAQAVSGVAPPVSAGALAQFQRAAMIRDLFFAGGGTLPSVSFTITPVSLDNTSQQVTLELGPQTITYAHGPLQPTQVTWPGAGGMLTARVVFDPPPPGGTGTLQASGPWALFQLFDKGNLQQGSSSDRYRLTFQLGPRQAVFEIQAASVLNPFAPGMLQAFRCPGL